MKNLNALLILLLVMAVNTGLQGQILPRIQNTNISLDNDRIIITYDLVDAKPGDKFEVWLRITGADGALIQGRKFSGDIGKNVEGGEGLVIYWNFEEDQITISNDISIQVMAEALNKTELSYLKALGMSAVLPGWGLAKMEDKKLYGLIAVAGYGSLAAGLAYTFNSKNTYQDYDECNVSIERDELYNKYTSQKDIGEIFCWSAAAIWVADIVWMSVKFGKPDNNSQASVFRRITLGCNYCPVSETPVFTMNIKF
jgi:hypothetical protein